MKTILIILTFMCNACIGQKKDSVRVIDSSFITWESVELLYKDIGKQVIEFNINDDTGTVFHYTTEDSTMFVSDSLRTIKWLIKLIVENAKKKTISAELIPDNYDTIPIEKTDTSSMLDYIWTSLPSSNQSIVFATTPIKSSGYIFGFIPISYSEPVSMLPLAIIFCLGALLIIGGIARLYEYIKTGK